MVMKQSGHQTIQGTLNDEDSSTLERRCGLRHFTATHSSKRVPSDPGQEGLRVVVGAYPRAPRVQQVRRPEELKQATSPLLFAATASAEL